LLSRPQAEDLAEAVAQLTHLNSSRFLELIEGGVLASASLRDAPAAAFGPLLRHSLKSIRLHALTAIGQVSEPAPTPAQEAPSASASLTRTIRPR
jgi:hypothetical protein